jgi:hypothetical protein
MRNHIRIFVVLLTLHIHAVAQIVGQQPVMEAAGAQFTFINNDRAHYFGLMEISSITSYQFIFKNSGTTPLVIKEMHASAPVRSDAPCQVVITYPKKPIKPGKKGVITVFVTAGNQTGSFKGEIYVSSNATDSNYALLLVLGAIVPNHEKFKDVPPDLEGYFQFLTPVIRANTN